MHLRSRRFCDALHPPIIERTLARISAACYATSITESSSAASRKRLVLPRCSRSRSLADSNSALLSPHSRFAILLLALGTLGTGIRYFHNSGEIRLATRFAALPNQIYQKNHHK